MLVLALPERPATGRGGSTALRAPRTARAEQEGSSAIAEAPAGDRVPLALPVAHRAPASDDPAVAQQAQAFDTAVRLRSEAEREMNALRELSMEQIKRDDELLKKWIALI
jgi:hypothetical protein